MAVSLSFWYIVTDTVEKSKSLICETWSYFDRHVIVRKKEHFFTKQDEHYLQYHLQDVTYSTYYIILP